MASRDAKGRGGAGRGAAAGRQGGASARQTAEGGSSSVQRRGSTARSGGATSGVARSGGARAAETSGGRSVGTGRGGASARDASAGMAGGRNAAPRSARTPNEGGRSATQPRSSSERPSAAARGAGPAVSSGAPSVDRSSGSGSSATAQQRAGRGGAESTAAPRPTAADVDRGLGTVGSWSDAGLADAPVDPAEGSVGTERVLDPPRADRPATGAGAARQGAAAQPGPESQPGSQVAGRSQGRQGVSPWFAGAENPFAMMRRMQDDLDRVFQAFGIPRLGASLAPPRELEELLTRSPALTQAAQWSPELEVFERGDSLVVRADLPGVKREDVEVNIDNDVLTIRGERRAEHRGTEAGYRRTERSYGTFFRQIPLPDGVEPSQIEASYEDGVLEVTIPSPRDQQRGRRRIDIR